MTVTEGVTVPCWRARRLLGLLCRFVALAGLSSVHLGARAAGRSFSFVVFGDCQFAINSPTSGVPERMAIPKAIVDLKPTFLLHTGDLMDHGWEPAAYDKFREYYEEMLSHIPFFPTMGNHDAGTKGIVNYKRFLESTLTASNKRAFGSGYERAFRISYEDDPTPYPTSFRSPNTAKYRGNVPSGVSFKTFYAFRHRNAYFLSFEQGTRWWANTPKEWVEKHLRKARADKAIDHVFATMHHPMYSTTMREDPPDPAKPGSGECIAPVRKHYEPLFRKYDVTIVFSGHAHLYDRCYVPDDDHETRREPPPVTYPHDGKGVHYIVTGGGGGALNRGSWTEERSYRYLQRRTCAHHVMRVEVSGKRLDVSMVEVKGSAETYTTSVFDRFTIAPGGQE